MRDQQRRASNTFKYVKTATRGKRLLDTESDEDEKDKKSSSGSLGEYEEDLDAPQPNQRGGLMQSVTSSDYQQKTD